MQNFNKFNDTDYISDAPSKLNNNFDSVKSDFAGTSFPTANLVEGMTCYRTDENKFYRYDGSAWQEEYEVITGGISVKEADHATQADDLPSTKYATQAQAEAGTDNTTVMTPLRTAQEMLQNASRKTVMLRYGESNINEIQEQSRSTIDEYGSGCPNLPTSHFYHILTNTGQDIGYSSQLAMGMTNSAVYYRNKTENTWNTWKKLATPGALSMPSAYGISVGITTSGQSYTAPCDGWMSIQFTPLAGYGGYCQVIHSSNVSPRLGQRVNFPAGLPYAVHIINVPLTKGFSYTIGYANITDITAQFYYAQSEV